MSGLKFNCLPLNLSFVWASLPMVVATLIVLSVLGKELPVEENYDEEGDEYSSEAGTEYVKMKLIHISFFTIKVGPTVRPSGSNE